MLATDHQQPEQETTYETHVEDGVRAVHERGNIGNATSREVRMVGQDVQSGKSIHQQKHMVSM